MARRPFIPLSGRAQPDGIVQPRAAVDSTEEHQRKIASVHMAMIAAHCVRTCLFLKTDPATLGLYVDQEPLIWHIRAAHRPDVTSLPAGIGGRLAWDTARFPDVDTAFQHALEDAWQSRHAH
jgi:hypothetical protein